MALQLVAKINSDEGIELNGAFVWLEIFLIGEPFVNLFYFVNKVAKDKGADPLRLSNAKLPARVPLKLPKQDFWGDDLALLIHERCKAAIEEVTGSGSVTIDQTTEA